MSDHDRFKDHAGAYVLGALERSERVAFTEHLDTCERCRSEVLDLAPVPSLLALVDLDDLLDPPPSGLADHVVDGVRREIDRIRAGRRRWRLAGIAAAVVALGLGVALVNTGRDDPRPEPDGVVLAMHPTEAAGGIEGRIVADERSWGTYVHVSLTGLPERDRYRVWAVDGDGAWHEAGSWLPTTDQAARLGASTHLRLADIAQVVVTSDEVDDHLLVAD